MKDKTKRLTRLFGVVGLSLCFGLSACNSVDSVDKQEYQYQEKLSRNNLMTLDDDDKSITIDNGGMLNSDIVKLGDYLSSNGHTEQNNAFVLSNSYVDIDDTQYTFNQLWVTINNGVYSIYCQAYNFTYGGYITYIYNPNNETLEDYSTASVGGPPASSCITYIDNDDIYDLFYVPPPYPLTFALSDFIQVLVSPISQFAFGVAGGVSTMATSLFLEVNDGVVSGLSVFGGIMALFCGLALAIHITTRVYLWITSLGKN